MYYVPGCAACAMLFDGGIVSDVHRACHNCGSRESISYLHDSRWCHRCAGPAGHYSGVSNPDALVQAHNAYRRVVAEKRRQGWYDTACPWCGEELFAPPPHTKGKREWSFCPQCWTAFCSHPQYEMLWKALLAGTMRPPFKWDVADAT